MATFQPTSRNAISRFADASMLPVPPPNVHTPIPSNNVSTSLGNIAVTSSAVGNPDISSVEALIQSQTPAALNILGTGTSEALRLSQAAQAAGTEPLDQFGNLDAFDERQALLGISGEQAQEQAIGDIPVSAFDQELQRRQRITQGRQSSAAGERGSGADLFGAINLAGGQQAQIIQDRLNRLNPLVGVSRGIRTDQSALDEAGAAERAGIQTGGAVQAANVRLGSAAPLIQSGLDQAELSGARNIGRARQTGQIFGQLSDLAAKFIPPSSLTPPPQAFPEAGILGVA